MFDVERKIRNLRAEADIDFFGLWLIASFAEDDLQTTDQREIMSNTLKVVEGLMTLGVYPGDYSFEETSFRFWTGSPAEQLNRIEAEWVAFGATPTLGDPICWFSLRPDNIAGEPVWIDGKWSGIKAA